MELMTFMLRDYRLGANSIVKLFPNVSKALSLIHSTENEHFGVCHSDGRVICDFLQKSAGWSYYSVKTVVSLHSVLPYVMLGGTKEVTAKHK